MTYNINQVIDGLKSYVENEIIEELPSSGKWFVWTVISLSAIKAHDIIGLMIDNQFIELLGIVDENGDIEVDELINALKESANKFGRLTIELPIVGILTFSKQDIEKLRMYIN